MEELIIEVRQLTQAINNLLELQNDSLIKQSEAARILGVASSTLSSMVKRGQIKAVTGVGKTLKFKKSDILKISKTK